MLNQKGIFTLSFIFFLLGVAGGTYAEDDPVLFWPPAPELARIGFVKSVYSPRDIGAESGLFKRLKRIISGEEKHILNKPMAVAVDKEKTIYVCDAGQPSLHIFKPQEKRYKKITTINGQGLLSPVCVAISDNGLVFIADSALRKIFCLDKEGRFKFSIGEDKEFLRPTGLAVSRDKLYVVDTLGSSILVFDLKGNFLLQFGRRGAKEGEFNYPTYIAVGPGGKVYVTDALNFRVQVFDENNKFLFCLGHPGDSSGSFSRPKGVAVDSFGHIYVMDGMFDNMQIFNQDKEFLLSLGQAGKGDGEFWIPSGLAIDHEDYIYVADSYNQRIQIFHYLGKE